MVFAIPELKKISVYINDRRPYKTIAEVKAETGADVVINGGLYNLTTRLPSQTLKAGGLYYALENEPYIGYGWDGDGANLRMTTDHVRCENFVSCISLARDGAPLSLHYPAEMGGVRGRVALGLNPGGSTVTYCSKDGTADACTPEALRDKMLALGCESALMLDGGQSSQCITPAGSIASARNTHSYICLWAEVYRVQVGAFMARANAEARKRELAAAGFPGSFIVTR